MNTVQSTHQFADAATARIQGLRRFVYPLEILFSTSAKIISTSEHCQLVIRQRPEIAKVAVGKEKGQSLLLLQEKRHTNFNFLDRKPVDPPPIIQLKISPQSDPAQNYLQSTRPQLLRQRSSLLTTFIQRSLLFYVM